MLRQDLVVIDLLAVELAVERVKVQAMFAGDEREGLVEIGAEFLGCAGFAGIISGDGDAAAESFAMAASLSTPRSAYRPRASV